MSESTTVLNDEIVEAAEDLQQHAQRSAATPDLSDPINQALLNDLDRRFAASNGNRQFFRARMRYYRKKLMWAVVINSARFVKRVVDISVSGLALIMLAPLFAGVALAIRLTDKGPILFWQKRVGKWGHEFDFPKFRSMVTNAEELKDKLLEQNDHDGGSVTFKMKRDPRVTWIGRIIRKLSIDELPQLWCVLKGEMSLVGPRPPVPREVAEYTLEDRRRLEATPGLTCIWQVSGRGDIPFDEQVQLDVQYIESQSLWFDIKLLLQTVPAVLLGKGAY